MAEYTSAFSDRINKLVSFIGHPISIWIIFGGSLCLTAFGYLAAKDHVYNRANDRFEFRANSIAESIEDRMQHYQQVLQGGVGLFHASQHVNRSEWARYVSSLDLENRLPGVQALGVSVPVYKEDLARHEKEIRSEGFPDYYIRPDLPRDLYTSILYIEPFDWRNQRAFGYDMYSDPTRYNAMKQSRDNGRTVMSGMVELVQETTTDKQSGFLMYLPVVKPSAEGSKFLGWVYAAFRMQDLINGVLERDESGLAFEIFDANDKQVESLLYDSNNVSSLNEKDHKPHFEFIKKIDIFDRTWTLCFTEGDDLTLLGFDHMQPALVLLAGLLVDGLLIYVIFCLNYIHRKARFLAKKLDSEFNESQKMLAWQTELVEGKEREANIFFEMAPDAFLVVDAKGEVVKANKHAHDLFGFRADELTGLKVESLVPKESAEAHIKHRSEFQKDPKARSMGRFITFEGVKADGSRFPISVNLVPVDLNGHPHTVAAVHDVSIQKNIEKTLADAKESAEVASRAKSDFVANMSHEIRTPLNAVLGSAQLLEKTSPDKLQEKYISMIRGSGEALLGVVNDILDFSKIEAGCMELANISFDLDDLLSRVGTMMSVNIGEKKIELAINVASRVPTMLMGDPLRLQQVLINLLSNAIKFTQDGLVVLNVTCFSNEVSRKNYIRLAFSVRDTGLGMDDKQKKRLFKAFSQADTSITREYGGTGLGLVISNQIINLMGGDIEVISDAGIGSCFTFNLDLAVSSEAKKWVVDENLKPQRILLLSDQSQTVSSMSNLFEGLGWSCSCYHDLGSIAQRFTRCDPKFDFVFIDRSFSAELIRVVEQLKNLGLPESATPILILSNNLEMAKLSDLDRDAFKSYLVKPILKNNIIESMSEGYLNNFGDYFLPQNQDLTKSRKDFSGFHVLLVEDNPLNQSVAIGMLENLGVNDVVVAENGLEGLTHIRNKPKHFDLILMDIQMPVMDGLSATKKIRSHFKNDIPIVAMTAGVLASEKKSYLDVGINDCIAKPVDEHELLRILSRYYDSEMSIRHDSEQASTIMSKAADEKGQEVFDVERINVLTKGTQQGEARLALALKRIVEKGPNEIEKGLSAIQIQNWEEAKFIFHGLKGVVANYGAEEVAHDIVQLESHIIDGRYDKEVVEAEAKKIGISFYRFSEAAAAWFIGKMPESTVGSNVSLMRTLPADLVSELSTAVQRQDIFAIEKGASDIEKLGEDGKALANRIRFLLSEFDTQGIRAVIEALSDAKK